VAGTLGKVRAHQGHSFEGNKIKSAKIIALCVLRQKVQFFFEQTS